MTASCWACLRPATDYCPTDDDGCGRATCDLCDCQCDQPDWLDAATIARRIRIKAGAGVLTDDDRRWLTDTAGARTTCDRRTGAGRCLLPLNHRGEHYATERTTPCA